jgi:hypothetical protein
LAFLIPGVQSGAITVIASTGEKGAVRTRLAATYEGRWQLALLASIIFDRTDAIRFFIWQPAYRFRSMRAT